MGIQTLQDYRDTLGATSLGVLQRSNIGNTLIDKWVNQALKEFGYAFKFHELEATGNFDASIGASSYSLELIGLTDFRYTEELWGTDPDNGVTFRIKPETRTHYRKNLGVSTDSTTYAKPRFYHRYQDKFFLRPIPDKVYGIELDYYRTIDDLVNGSDTSPFHEDWDEAVLVGAWYRGFRHFGEFDRYQNVRNDFLALVRSRKTEYELEEFPEGGISPLGPDDTEDVEEAL